MFDLIVTHPFGAYQIGQRISALADVEAIQKGHNHTHVVRVPKLEEAVAPVEEKAPLKEQTREADDFSSTVLAADKSKKP